jgi:hypothetical protein
MNQEEYQQQRQELTLDALPNDNAQQMMSMMQRLLQNQEQEANRLTSQIDAISRTQVRQQAMLEDLAQHQQGHFESVEGTLENMTRQQEATHSVLGRFRTECMSQLDEIKRKIGRMRTDCHFTTIDGWIECIKQFLLLLLSLAKSLCVLLHQLHILMISLIRTTTIVPWIGSLLAFVLEISFYMVETFFAITIIDFVGFVSGINPDMGGLVLEFVSYIFFQGIYYLTWIIHQFGKNIAKVPTRILRAFQSSDLNGIVSDALNEGRVLVGEQYNRALNEMAAQVLQGVNDQLPSLSDYVPDVSPYVPNVSPYVPDVAQYVPTCEGFQELFRLPNLGGTKRRQRKSRGKTSSQKKNVPLQNPENFASTKMGKSFDEMEKMLDRLFSSIDMSKVKGVKLSTTKLDQIHQLMDKCVPLINTIKAFIGATFDANDAWIKHESQYAAMSASMTPPQHLYTPVNRLAPNRHRVFFTISKFIKKHLRSGRSNRSSYNTTQRKIPISVLRSRSRPTRPKSMLKSRGLHRVINSEYHVPLPVSQDR